MATGQASTPAPAAPDEGPLYGQWQWVRNHPPYIPEWTDPEWSPNVEYSIRGIFKRDVNVDTGTILRPAILPGDADKNPTEFARYASSSAQLLEVAYPVVVYCCLPDQIVASASIPKLSRLIQTQLSVVLSSPRRSTRARSRRVHGERQKAGSRMCSVGRRPKRSVELWSHPGF